MAPDPDPADPPAGSISNDQGQRPKWSQTCTKCDVIITNKKGWLQHLRSTTHRGAENRRVVATCSDCRKTFVRADGLRKHHREKRCAPDQRPLSNPRPEPRNLEQTDPPLPALSAPDIADDLLFPDIAATRTPLGTIDADVRSSTLDGQELAALASPWRDSEYESMGPGTFSSSGMSMSMFGEGADLWDWSLLQSSSFYPVPHPDEPPPTRRARRMGAALIEYDFYRPSRVERSSSIARPPMEHSKHSCPDCGKQFQYPKDLRRHRRPRQGDAAPSCWGSVRKTGGGDADRLRQAFLAMQTFLVMQTPTTAAWTAGSPHLARASSVTYRRRPTAAERSVDSMRERERLPPGPLQSPASGPGSNPRPEPPSSERPSDPPMEQPVSAETHGRPPMTLVLR